MPSLYDTDDALAACHPAVDELLLFALSAGLWQHSCPMAVSVTGVTPAIFHSGLRRWLFASSGASLFFLSRFIEGPPPVREIQAEADWLSDPAYAHEIGEITVLLRIDWDRQPRCK